MYTLHFKEGLISFFLFTRFTIADIVYARVFLMYIFRLSFINALKPYTNALNIHRQE